MPISLEELASTLSLERTVLLFGAGSSIPSGAPSVSNLKDALSTQFGIDSSDLNFVELATLVEKRRSRGSMIACIRKLFQNLQPTGGMLTIPRFRWKSIFTTNYDTLLEAAFRKLNVPISVFASNFDFRVHETPQAMRLLKLHGTIDQDVSDGHRSRMIATEPDYNLTQEFREFLFDSLKADLAGADLVVVGHSLSDPDIREVVNRSIELRSKSPNAGNAYILAYSKDADRAELYESRGLKVCFGGIDDFAAAMTKAGPATVAVHTESGDPIEASRLLPPITVVVSHAATLAPSVSQMFNGRPATYSDISAGNTFSRSLTAIIEAQLFSEEHFGAVLLGAAGVGKTTISRQVVLKLLRRGFHAWEHNSDHQLLPSEWVKVAEKLQREEIDGVLFVDDADSHLFEINALFEKLSALKLTKLRVVLASARNHWNPRVKSPAIFVHGKTHILERLDSPEIADLLRLVEVNQQVAALVDGSFMAFSVGERRRRLEDRCERDMFVCLKNIFAAEKFDDIVLREYATLSTEYREVYKLIAALESSGVRVHRQLVVRLLGIPMNSVSSVLEHLTDIVHEYAVNERDGIYAWRGRHPVIMGIIAEYKFSESDSFANLFERVVDALNPTYDIEVRTLRELCGIPSGIRRISDLNVQNRILARMISVAPGERVPRHRLIRNLIELGHFDQADVEIRLFSKDFREDGPVYRYRVKLALERARLAPGILEEDRLVILEKAKSQAAAGIARYPNYKNLLFVYAEIGIELFKRTKNLDTFDEAMKELRLAEQQNGDPDITRQISYYERRVTGNV